MINKIAEKLDSRTVLLQYLEALKDIAVAPSTKIVLLMELFGLIRPLERIPKTLSSESEKSSES